jgi:hypothetical protein
VTDRTYEAAKRHFSDRALTEILYVVGSYMLVARVLRTGHVPLDDKPVPVPEPQITGSVDQRAQLRKYAGEARPLGQQPR